eukprot:TRINITY_DN36897_c0_g1_i2.p1 TRINITY_DN36897_c0_g1~~TRINITY_DN36897_c0_g1_i2.p1  ORF type:complete len:847 (+),score=191.94 TRINITY_DN36897_c0_g1_i2:324-2543(+)
MQTSLSYLIPALAARLGAPEIVEPTEEIRLALMELIHTIIKKDGAKMAEYIDEIAIILQRCFADPFPELKQATARCAVTVAAALPTQAAFHSEALVKAMLPNLTHQQYKVRVRTVESLGAMIPCGAGELIEELVPMLQNLSCDRNNSVRAKMVEVMGTWLCTLQDRFSHQQHLLPMLLTAINDEIPAIASSAAQQIEKLGAQYSEEHAEDEKWKEKMDYGVEEVLDVVLPPPFESRPSVGARAYVREKLSAMLPPYLRRVSDWTKDSRVTAAGVLQALTVYAEHHMVAHLEAILQAVVRVAKDDEPEVRDAVHSATKVLGQYVDPGAYAHILFPQIRGQPGAAASQRTNALAILTSLVQGSAVAKTLQPHLKNIASELSHASIIQSEDTTYVQELVTLIKAMMQGAGEQVQDIGYPLFLVLVQVQCSQTHAAAAQLATEAITTLSQALGLASPEELYANNLDALLSDLLSSHAVWTKASNERFAFDAIVRSAVNALAPRVPDLLPVFLSLCADGRDPEVRFAALELLAFVVEQESLSQALRPHVPRLMQELIIPCMTWKAGRVYATARLLTAVVLRGMFKSQLIDVACITPVADKLIPVLVSALEDDLPPCRGAMCNVMVSFVQVFGTQMDYEQRRHFYPELLKRLDDADDKIRQAVTPAISAFVDSLPSDYSTDHYGRIIDGLLVHLDDPNKDIQRAIADVIRHVGQFNKDISRTKLAETRPRLRNFLESEDLLAALS